MYTYPEDFSNYSQEDLLQLLELLYQTGDMYNNALSPLQKRNLLAKLAAVRADLNQTIQHLDEAIGILCQFST